VRLLVSAILILSSAIVFAEETPKSRYFVITGINAENQFVAYDPGRGAEFIAEFTCGSDVIYDKQSVALKGKGKVLNFQFTWDVAAGALACNNLITAMKDNLEIDDFVFEYSTVRNLATKVYSRPKESKQ
jgi:hypothetical protein